MGKINKIAITILLTFCGVLFMFKYSPFDNQSNGSKLSFEVSSLKKIHQESNLESEKLLKNSATVGQNKSTSKNLNYAVSTNLSTTQK
jgi:hypothetical protein